MSNTASFQVKPLQSENWPLLKAVRIEALADSPEAFGMTLAEAQSRTDAEWQDYARRFTLSPPAVSYFAFADGTPCGMANCFVSRENTQIAEMTAFWVAPEQRRLGVGAALVAAVIDWATAQGMTTLQAWVVENNVRALSFYKKLGFQETNQRQPHTPDPTKQIVLMVKEIEDL